MADAERMELRLVVGAAMAVAVLADRRIVMHFEVFGIPADFALASGARQGCSSSDGPDVVGLPDPLAALGAPAAAQGRKGLAALSAAALVVIAV